MSDPKYRVFISYAHWDWKSKDRLEAVIKGNGMKPWSDDKLAAGTDFTKELQDHIASCHVFMPLISDVSSGRQYVQQEIGYALALGVPILPVSKGGLPEGMLGKLHPVKLDDDPRKVKTMLSRGAIEKLVNSESHPLYECANTNDERIRMHAERAERILGWGLPGRVRHRGPWSSFSVPDKPVGDKAWSERYGNRLGIPSVEKCRMLRRERRALEAHARARGCSLILNLHAPFEYGPVAHISRLRVLLAFLKSMRSDKVKIALTGSLPQGETETIVGDWYLVHGAGGANRRGYVQSVFTRHAPTVLHSIDTFDDDLLKLLDEQKVKPECSKEVAKRKIAETIREESAKLNPKSRGSA